MATTPLIIQSVISGLFFLVGTLFFALPLIGARDLANLSFLKEYQFISSLVVLGLSYVFGSFFKNIINMTFPLLVKFIRQKPKKIQSPKDKKTQVNRTELLINVNQYGSPSLIELLGSRSRSLSFYQTLAFGIPYFGLGYSSWLFWKETQPSNWFFGGISLFVGILFYLVYRRKRNSQTVFENTLARVIDNYIKKKTKR